MILKSETKILGHVYCILLLYATDYVGSNLIDIVVLELQGTHPCTSSKPTRPK